MDKAYDLKALAEKLKATGIPLALDSAEAEAGKVYVAVKEWLKESATLSPNKIDDFVAGFYDQLDPIVLPLIDKINGKVG
jgi:hypothetical protein